MKFQNLPASLLSKICTLLDPKSRIFYLLALQNFYSESEETSNRRYHCYFCFFEMYYEAVVHEQVYDKEKDEFNLYRKLVKYKKIDEKTIERSRQRFLLKKFEKRDYSVEDPELNLIFNHLGKNSFPLFISAKSRSEP